MLETQVENFLEEVFRAEGEMDCLAEKIHTLARNIRDFINGKEGQIPVERLIMMRRKLSAVLGTQYPI